MTAIVGEAGASLPVRAKKAHKRSPFALPLAVTFLGLVFAAAIVLSDSPWRALLTAATGAAILLPILAKSVNGAPDLFEPIVPATFALLTMFVLRPLADQILHSYVHLGYDISGTFDQTLLVAFFGCLTFSLGYLSRFGRDLAKLYPRPQADFSPRKATRAAIAIAMLGVVVFGTFISTHGGLATLLLYFGGRGSQSNSIYTGNSAYQYDSIHLLMPSMLIFVACWIRSRKSKYLVGAVATGLPLAAMNLGIGSRSELLPMLGGPVAIYYIAKSTRPKPIRVVAISLIVLAAFSLIREIRNPDSADLSLVSSALSNPSKAVEVFVGTFTQDDSEMFDSLATTIDVFPDQIPYNPLGLFSDFATRALPRTLFPNKPLEMNYVFLATMWPARFSVSPAGTANSLLGNFYFYGGLPAVMIGCFITAVFLSSTWAWCMANSQNLNALILYAFVPTSTIILLRGNVVDTVSRLVFTAVPVILAQVFWAVARSSKSRRSLSLRKV